MEPFVDTESDLEYLGYDGHCASKTTEWIAFVLSGMLISVNMRRYLEPDSKVCNQRIWRLGQDAF